MNVPRRPQATLAILGGGQLAQMLALAAYPLGIRCRVLDPADSPPAAGIAEHIQAAFDDREALLQLVEGVSCLSYEFENVPAGVFDHLPSQLRIAPAASALAFSQDRLEEKQLFNSLGIQTAEYRPVQSPEEIRAALDELGVPSVLKTRRFGYDGKGQAVLRSHKEIQATFEMIGSTELILEAFVPFKRELSIIGVRSLAGEMRFYPLTENVHQDGILRQSLAPAPHIDEELLTEAEDYVRRLSERLNYCGVLCLELFDCGDRLLANEFAPRVHNSGHWTIEGCSASQFENHVRAVLGLPLGDTRARGHCAMLNIIGSMPERSRLLESAGVHLHDYGKEERKGRKLGHLGICSSSEADRENILNEIKPLVWPQGRVAKKSEA